MVRAMRMCARIGLASLLTAAFGLAACGDGDETGPGQATTAEGLPEGAVALVRGVEDGAITREDLNRAVAARARASGQQAPATQSPEYDLVAGEALDDLLVARWIAGEAAARGIVVSEEEVAGKVEETLDSRFGGDSKEFEAVAARSGYCSEEELASGTPVTECEGVLDRARTGLLLDRLEIAGNAELEAEWAPRTECAPELVSRLCGGTEPPPPPDIPPASG